MAEATLDPTLSTDLNAYWRKVQTGVYQGFNFEVEEYDAVDRLNRFRANMSTREITVPLDITEGYGAASIPEDGWEAVPSSPNARELSLAWVIFSKTFSATRQSKWVDQHSRGAMIERQIKVQGVKAIQTLAGHVGDYIWMPSTGYIAQEGDGGQGANTSHTITLTNGGGYSWITDAEYITRRLRVGDRVALINGGALVTNAIGTITARSLSAGTITVTWNGSVTIGSGDYIVKANSMENTTIAGTDYNRGLIGFPEAVLATSLHGLATSTEAEWASALTDTSGGRLTGIRLRKLKDEIGNWGGGKLTDMWIAQGVRRDMIALAQAAVRFSSPMSMELDGEVKEKGVTFHDSRRVPPGAAFGYDKSAVHKLLLLPSKPSEPMWDDGYKIPHRPVWVFPIEWPMQLVYSNRKKLGIFHGLTEQ